MAGALVQTIIVLVLYALVLTFVGMFALKYFVRQLPLLSHAMIFFWAVFRVLLAATALWAIVFFLKIEVPSQLSGLLVSHVCAPLAGFFHTISNIDTGSEAANSPAPAPG